MRLDFNIYIVDDDWNDEDANGDIKDLINSLDFAIKQKGFILKSECFANPNSLPNLSNNRVDLFISDNNLGFSNYSENSNDGGIELFLNLKSQFLCDFILYTRSETNGIINKLVSDLQTSKDPNLFSRFTFVSRNSGDQFWHETIINVVNHMLTKREEINNLRGLFAQLTGEIDHHLHNISKITKKKTLEGIINFVAKKKLIASNLKNDLHKQRKIRNGIIHNNEEFCTTTNNWYITYNIDANNPPDKIYETDFESVRTDLSKIHKQVMALK